MLSSYHARPAPSACVPGSIACPAVSRTHHQECRQQASRCRMQSKAFGVSCRTVSYRKSSVMRATQRGGEKTASDEKQEGHEEDQSPGGMFQSLVSNLLKGAASRLERGPTTCLTCKGTGTLVCPNCKGQGVVAMSQVRMKTVGRVSNRCPKCGGNGRMVCNVCKGRGFRGDFVE